MKPLHLLPRLGLLLTLLTALLLTPGMVLAGQATAQPDRATLERQRRVVQADFERELQACQARFAVTACIDEARERRRVADAPLRETLLQLEAQARRQRALGRQRAVNEKLQVAAAQRQAAAASAAASATTGRPASKPAP